MSDSPLVREVPEPTVSSFLEVIEGLVMESPPHPIWYRGHARSTWRLQPKLFRDESPPLMKSFCELAEEFTRVGDRHVVGGLLDDYLDAMFVMQHVGLPTPLLDWTLNPLAALFFAVEGGYRDDSAPAANTKSCVWLLDDTMVKERLVAYAFSGESPEYGEVRPPTGERLAEVLSTDPHYHLAQEHCSPIVIPVRPMVSVPRHVAQQGVATLHSNSTPLEEWMTPRPGLARVDFPSGWAHQLQRQLHQLGINRFQLFGGLDALAASLEADARM